ncbi:hypothetical protein V1477_011127 [Vespula maculifrons]|uniref:Uncharacterized protein n=1 Tax=Vespula maculifrons TaxID=7453 RepID=A0ABD2C3W9_VESMC
MTFTKHIKVVVRSSVCDSSDSASDRRKSNSRLYFSEDKLIEKLRYYTIFLFNLKRLERASMLTRWNVKEDWDDKYQSQSNTLHKGLSIEGS